MSRSLENHLNPDIGPKRILSLSGGGVRGLITLGMLSALEAIYRDETGDPDARLCDHYDLIAGTSTGSIIATALALGWPVSKIKAFYLEICPVLFKPNSRMGVLKSRFDAKPLRDILQTTLRDGDGNQLTLGSDRLRTGLLICAKRMDTDSAWVLSNNPRSKFYNAEPNQTWMPNKHYTLASLIQASAAAPSFLEPVVIDVGNTERGYASEPALFVDGGISGHNCPALIAYQVATLEPYGFNWKSGPENLAILSLGTGQARVRHNVDEFRAKATYKQALDALKGLIAESQRSVIMTMQAMSNPRHETAWTINGEVGDLDGALMTAEPLFHFRHIDAHLDDARVQSQLRLKGRDEKKVDKIADGVRDMANGRKKNLTYCEQIGMSVGSGLSRDDLFL